jgi:hypothetical protein
MVMTTNIMALNIVRAMNRIRATIVMRTMIAMRTMTDIGTMIYMEAMTNKMTASSWFTKCSQKRYNICSRITTSIIIASMDKRDIIPNSVIDAQSR